MKETALTAMNYAEFQHLMDAYITRSAQRDDALPATTFLTLLFDLLGQRASNVVQLEGQIINGKLVLSPVEEAAPVQVQGNRILLDNWQFVVTLKNETLQPV